MAYLSLYRKHRPQRFSEIIGQEHVARTLANAVTEDRVAHAYLFTGPRGTGKTSTARILAKALNCEQGPTAEPCGKCDSCVAIAEGSSLDVIEMDAASHSKVDETRDVLAGVPLATAGGRRKVYVIDEVHMLTTQSFNALLKTLEEPPAHVVFVLATTEAHKVLPTIVSRTQRFDFRRVPADALEQHLGEIAKLENIDIDPGALSIVARHADGGVRDALSALDQLAALGEHISIERAEQLLGQRAEDQIAELFEAIAASDVGRVFGVMNSLMNAGEDPRQLADGVMEHARTLLLLRTAPEAEELLDGAAEDVGRARAQTDLFTGSGLLRILDLVAKAITEMRNSPNHRLLLEVALVRAADPVTDPSSTGLLGRIERLERRVGIEGRSDLPAEPVTPPATTPAAPTSTAPANSPTQTREIVEEPPSEDATRTPDAGSAGEAAHQVGLGHMRDAWPAVLKELGRVSKRVAAFLHSSQALSYTDGELTVEVQSGFHAEQMAAEQNRSMLLAAVHAALGVQPSSIAFVGRDGAAPPTPKEEPATAEDIRALAESQPVDDQDSDPIELVKKGLAAEVVEERDS